MSDLAGWLLEQIAADEAAARAASGHRWYTAAHLHRNLFFLQFDADHIARHDPARVLADCEAKRRIVEREDSRLREQWRRYSDEHRQSFDDWFRKPYGEVLRLLALPYADRPGYREEWKP